MCKYVEGATPKPQLWLETCAWILKKVKTYDATQNMWQNKTKILLFYQHVY